MKKCSKCSQEKPLFEFYVNATYKGGYIHTCKVCFRLRNKTYKKNNKLKIRQMTQNWKDNNREYVNSQQQEWRKNTGYCSNYLNNINNKIAHNLRVRLGKLLRSDVKIDSAVDSLGCSVEELKKHLESQFEPWMNWNNYGKCVQNRLTWNIDHIIPLCKVDLIDPEQFKKVCHYTNLRPLLAKANSSKGGR